MCTLHIDRSPNDDAGDDGDDDEERGGSCEVGRRRQLKYPLCPVANGSPNGLEHAELLYLGSEGSAFERGKNSDCHNDDHSGCDE